MEKVFSYLDYREFLKARFARLKKTVRITHRSLAKKAGFSSPNFFKLVIEGQRNLSESSIEKIGKALDLEPGEIEFFAQLVRFNQAKRVEEKEAIYEQLKLLRRDLPLRRLEHSQYEYFGQWYAVAIRELIALKDFREDPEWIAAKLGNRVTATQARRALALLERLGLICRDPKGRLLPQQAPLSTGNEVASLAAYRFHRHMIDQAKRALSETPASHRDISSITLAVSKENCERIKQKIRQFRKEILAMSEEGTDAEVLYQMNIQFFNLTELK